MNYIYDITLNFNNELYNFYEWNKDDNVEFYLKIPVFRVEDNVLNDFINTSFVVENQFLNKIINKTELYGKTSVVNKKYTCIFVSNNNTIAVVFNDKGECTKKSYLSIDEEKEVLEFSEFIKYTLVNYKIKEKKKTELFLTRKEKNEKLELKKILNNMYKNKEFDKLKYLFYEVYEEKSDNEEKIYSKLRNLIENNSEKTDKIYTIFNKLKPKEIII